MIHAYKSKFIRVGRLSYEYQAQRQGTQSQGWGLDNKPRGRQWREGDEFLDVRVMNSTNPEEETTKDGKEVRCKSPLLKTKVAFSPSIISITNHNGIIVTQLLFGLNNSLDVPIFGSKKKQGEAVSTWILEVIESLIDILEDENFKSENLDLILIQEMQ